MNHSIKEQFIKARDQNRAAFIPFLSGGYPHRQTFLSLLKLLDQNGADIIEVGIPFSDPLADGPVIQRSSQLALDAGVTPAEVLELLAQARPDLDAALVVMTYWNPVLQMGPERFARRANEAGVQGVIVPDLPVDEADDWREVAVEHNLDTIFMVAPTTPESRARAIAEASRGFVYFVSMTGVTGSALTLEPEILAQIAKVRQMSDCPVAVGFGVSSAGQAHELAQAADGVIVGSALMKLLLNAETPEAAVTEMEAWAVDFRRGLEHS
jgi:tryptophan synthase alpha chain